MNHLNGQQIHVSHINIRTSIWLMLFRVIVLECLFSSVYFLFIIPLFLQELQFSAPLLSFIKAGVAWVFFVKPILSVYIVLQWVNEYYEVRPDRVLYRRGLLFRKEAHYVLERISLIGLKQSLLGKIFNFGTLSLYDIDTREYIYFYYLHNPLRYYRILETLLPGADEDKRVIRTKLYDAVDDGV